MSLNTALYKINFPVVSTFSGGSELLTWTEPQQPTYNEAAVFLAERALTWISVNTLPIQGALSILHEVSETIFCWGRKKVTKCPEGELRSATTLALVCDPTLGEAAKEATPEGYSKKASFKEPHVEIPEWFINRSMLLNQLMSNEQLRVRYCGKELESSEDQRSHSSENKLIALPPELLQRIKKALPLIKQAALTALETKSSEGLYDKEIVDIANYFGIDLFGEVLVRLPDPMPAVQYYLEQKQAMLAQASSSEFPILGIEGQITAQHLGEVLVKASRNYQDLQTFLAAFSAHNQFKNIPGEKVVEALLNAKTNNFIFKLLCAKFNSYFTSQYLSGASFEKILLSIEDPKNLLILMKMVKKDSLKEFLNPNLYLSPGISTESFSKIAQLVAQDPNSFMEFLFLFESLELDPQIPPFAYFTVLPLLASNQDLLKKWHASFLKTTGYRIEKIPPSVLSEAFIKAAGCQKSLHLFCKIFSSNLKSKTLTQNDLSQGFISSVSNVDALKLFLKLFSLDLYSFLQNPLGVFIVDCAEAFIKACGNSIVLKYLMNHEMFKFMQVDRMPIDQYMRSLLKASSQIETFNLWSSRLKSLPQFNQLTEADLGKIFVRAARNNKVLAYFIANFLPHPNFNCAPFLGEAIAASASNYKALQLIIDTFSPNRSAISDSHMQAALVNTSSDKRSLLILKRAFSPSLPLPQPGMNEHLAFLKKSPIHPAFTLWNKFFRRPTFENISADHLGETLSKVSTSSFAYSYFVGESLQQFQHINAVSAEHLGKTLVNLVFYNYQQMPTFLKAMKGNPNLAHISAEHLGITLKHLCFIYPQAVPAFIEVMKNNLNRIYVSAKHLGYALMHLSSKDPQDVMEFVDAMKDNCNLVHVSAEHLGVALTYLASETPQTLAPFLEAMKDNCNLAHVSAEHLSTALIHLASEIPQTLAPFLEAMKDNLNLAQVSATHLEIILGILSSKTPQFVLIFLSIMKNNANLIKISTEYLAGIQILFAKTDPQMLLPFLEVLKDNPNLLQISAEHQGIALTHLASKDPQELLKFIEAMKGNSNLLQVSAEHLGIALMHLASETSQTLLPFLEAMKGNSNLLQISAEHLGIALTHLASRNSQTLLPFLEAMKGNSNLLQVSAEHLGIALMHLASETPQILAPFLEAMKGNSNLPQVSAEYLGIALMRLVLGIPQKLLPFFEVMKGNSSLLQISAEHLGIALTHLASRNVQTLLPFLEAMKGNSNLLQVSAEHLGIALTHLASRNVQTLLPFLEAMKGNSNLLQISEKHLEKVKTLLATKAIQVLDLFLKALENS